MTKDRELNEIFEKELFKGEIKFDEPLSEHTSLKIGGPVEIMVFPEDPLSLKNVLLAAGREDIPVFIMGGGTNLLVGDGLIEGIAVSLKAFDQVEDTRESDEEKVVLYVGAGVQLPALVAFAKKNGYSGLEALSGIPGLFGGAVYMNAGSFGTEMKDVVRSVAVMNRQGEIMVLQRNEVDFLYRNSNLPAGSIILSANIVLKKESRESVEKRTKEFFNRKKVAQPLGEASAGCVFKNPEGDSAGRLIDEAGCKGMTIGHVKVSTVHANFFINKGNAECRDFIELMEAVKIAVREQSGIELKPEIIIVNPGK